MYEIACPICSKIRTFKSYSGFYKAKKGTPCKSCANSIQSGGNGKIIQDNKKWCSYCKTYKDFDEFSTYGVDNRLKSRCKICQTTYNIEYHKVVFRFSRYGITREDFVRRFREQDGRCAICNTEITDKTCHIDHDHESKKVRGLLCDLCNKGLGQFRDSISNLQNAISYLKNNK